MHGDSQQHETETDGEICNDNGIVIIDDIEAVSHNILLVSTDEKGVTVSADINSSSTESDDEKLSRSVPCLKNGGKNHDSGRNRKWSEKFD